MSYCSYQKMRPRNDDQPSKATHRVRASTADTDPLKMLRALEVLQYLRSSRCFKNVMAAAHRYDHGEDAPPRDHTADASRTTFDRAASKLDSVDMVMERRVFRADR